MTRTEHEFEIASAGVVTASDAIAFFEKSARDKADRTFLNLAFQKALKLVTTFKDSIELFWIASMLADIENEPERFSSSFVKALEFATTENELDTILDKAERNGYLGVAYRAYIRQVFDKADSLGFLTK